MGRGDSELIEQQDISLRRMEPEQTGYSEKDRYFARRHKMVLSSGLNWRYPYISQQRPFLDKSQLEDAEYLGQEWPTSKMPVPFISWSPIIIDRNWLEFDENAEKKIHDSDYMLCQICGEQLGDDKIFAIHNRTSFAEDYHKDHDCTTGNGMHPRCALLAYHYCPYLQKKGVQRSFKVFTGPGHGLHPDFDEHDSRSVLTQTPISDQAEPISVEQIKQLMRAKA